MFSVRVAPSTATIRRVLNAVCPGGLADLLGTDPAGADTLAVDGKNARGSRTVTSPAAHLPAAMTGTGQTVTQLRVPDKTNEITCFAALLEPFDLAGVTVTADALCRHRHNPHVFIRRPAHPARPCPVPGGGETGALPAGGQGQPARAAAAAEGTAVEACHRPALRP
ncbi:hypothetical protein ACSCBZ_02400 [Streptomyces niveiscabiei]|uniref:transposase n=1 Tax=Streptomyces TaxID=1883 RepID=UPI000B0695C2|nr:transposase [Streptomyces sp. V2]